MTLKKVTKNVFLKTPYSWGVVGLQIIKEWHAPCDFGVKGLKGEI